MQDYPDYYEVIKKPMDMSSISSKMMQKKYESIEDMVADFVQMFDNACKYNEPDSLIYKVGLYADFDLCLECHKISTQGCDFFILMVISSLSMPFVLQTVLYLMLKKISICDQQYQPKFSLYIL